MPKLPLYTFKFWEELGRGVVVAVITYAITAITTGGLPQGQDAWIALATGAGTVVLGAVRDFLNKTPITPDA